MPTDSDNPQPVNLNPCELQETDLPAIVREVRRRTPARLLVGRTGTAYKTATQMELRQAHAAARDAVRTELDLQRDLGASVIAKWNLFEACTQASSKDEYLMRPDLGRRLAAESRAEVLQRCDGHKDVQIAIGDGLSVTAVRAQVPGLLKLLYDGAVARGWTVGQMFVVRYCRVGILNEIGELLAPKVAILLIGERPGLATAESLSAYLAYQPKSGNTDADRNLISNIHGRGVGATEGAHRILNLTEAMIATQRSGFALREQSTPLGSDEPNE
jgi:ethanolamine ammonia-lyase small subunit